MESTYLKNSVCNKFNQNLLESPTLILLHGFKIRSIKCAPRINHANISLEAVFLEKVQNGDRQCYINYNWDNLIITYFNTVYFLNILCFRTFYGKCSEKYPKVSVFNK